MSTRRIERPAKRRRGRAGSSKFRDELEAKKRESALQLLLRVARRVDEEALRRVVAREDRTKLRRAHTSLFPHIDLEGTRITTLAERLGISKQAVSQHVDDLEALDVLARIPDPSDGRATLVVFTRHGERGLLEGLALLRDLERDLARSAGIGARQLRELRQTLLRLDGALDHLDQAAETQRDAGGC